MAYKYMATAVLLYLLCLCPVRAQKEANIWYFGGKAGISFTGFTPAALSGSAMNTPEGCASIADISGKLLFYTNGVNVWTNTHTLMVGGTRLAGNESTTQSALIIPAPGRARYFYIFTIATDNDTPILSYSIVDIDEQNGQGAVTTLNIPLPEVGMVTEKITAIRHNNKRDVWILVHGRESNAFYASLLTPSGIDKPVISNVGTIHTGAISAIGAMKATPNGNNVAVAVFDKGIEVFDFDNTTGRLSNTVNLFRSDLQGYYGVEFSPDGSKLYSSADTRSSVQQFNLQAGSPSDILASAVEIWAQTDNDQGGALQLAPDGKIYRARSNKRQLDVIAYPNALGLSCKYLEKGVELNEGKCRLGLPTIFPDYLRMRFTYYNACPGDTTRFSLTNPDGIDAVLWKFGDLSSGTNKTSSLFSPWYIYPSHGSYTVELTTYAKGSLVDQVEYEIRILPLPPTGLSRDTLLCANSELFLQAEKPEYTAYKWSTNEQTSSIRITTPGTYWVQVFNQQCTRTDTIRVHPSPFVFATPPDTSLCADIPLQLQASGAQHYFWHDPIAPEQATSATQTVTTTTTTTYTVTGIDANGCSLTRSFTVARVPLPVISLGNDTTFCYSPMHALDAGISGAKYEWSTGERSQRIDVSSTGTYWVRVSTNGCSTSDTIAIVFALPHTITADTSICPGDGVQLQATGFASYQWSPAEGLSNTTIANPTATPVQTTTYTVRGTTPEGCTIRDSVTVAIVPQATVSLFLPALTPTVGVDNTRIAIRASSSTPLLVLPSMRILLSIDQQYFAPLSATRGIMTTTSTNALAVIDIPSVVLSQQQQTLTEIVGIPLSGNGHTTTITVSVVLTDNCIATTMHEGTIAVQGCVTSKREVGFSTSTQLIVHSNPTESYAELHIATTDDYGYALALYDIHGREHWRYTTPYSPPPNTFATVALPTHTLANGMYQVVLTTPSAVRTHTLHVLR